MNQLLQSNQAKLALVAAGLYALHRFVPHPMAKTAAVAVGAVLVAKQLPVTSELLKA